MGISCRLLAEMRGHGGDAAASIAPRGHRMSFRFFPREQPCTCPHLLRLVWVASPPRNSSLTSRPKRVPPSRQYNEADRAPPPERRPRCCVHMARGVGLPIRRSFFSRAVACIPFFSRKVAGHQPFRGRRSCAFLSASSSRCALAVLLFPERSRPKSPTGNSARDTL